MNLKPWNAIRRSLSGDVGTLPTIPPMQSLYLDDDDVIATSFEGLRCFFYLFRVPEAWCKYMVFGIRRQGTSFLQGVITIGDGFCQELFHKWGI